MAQDNKNKVLNVPPLRFPEFIEDWELQSLSEYLTFKNGLNPDAKRFGRGVKFISVMDILKNDFITYDAIISLVEPQKDDFEGFGVEYGDVLFQRSSETFEDIGRANVYLDDRKALFGGFVIRGKQIKRYNPRFIKYLLSAPCSRKKIIVKGAGAQHFNIGQEGLSKVVLNFPSLDEQEKIGKFLSLIDERIATQNKIIDNLQSLIKGLVERCHKEAHGRHVRLGDILTEKTEKTTTNNQYEVLSSTTAGIYTQREYFNKDIASENNIGYKVVRMYDVVLSPQNLWMGNINYNNKYEIGMVSPSYKVFTIDNHFDKAYIALLLKTHRALYDYALVSEQGASVVRRNLNLEQFYELSYKVPDYRQQKLIGNLWSTYQCKLECEISIRDSLIKQRNYLLTEMFI